MDLLLKNPGQVDTKLVQSIDFWVANFKQEDFAQTTPLLITGPPGAGKSTLIAKWLGYHREYSAKDNNLIIYENPALTSAPSYAQSLFNVLDTLRKEYELNIKVSVKEERLRTQFSKLFENNHSLPMPKKTRKCVVIIFDGVDLYRINSGREDTAEWLPVVIPENIRLIYTCAENSEAFRFLSPLCKVLKVPELRRKYRLRLLNSLTSATPDLLKSENLEQLQTYIREESSTSNPLFLKLLITWSLTSHIKTPAFTIPTFKEIPSVETLFTYAIRFFASSCSSKIKKVLSVLKISKNSLRKKEIALSSGVSLKQTSKILEIFDPCLLKQEDFYCFSNYIFRDCLEVDSQLKIAREISLVLEDQNDSTRVHELLNSLKVSKDWKRLKDKLRNIQVFVSMFNTKLKIELCNLWLELEKNGFDPVEEYNKAIEDFISNHPLLKPEDTVNLVINFFCFFDEYGLLECPKSVNFRNYPLVHKESLEQVGLFTEAEKISGIFNKTPTSPLFEYECKMFSESMRDQLRDFVVKMNLDNSKKTSTSPAEFYHYKRWFWIQFPLIALSASVNASSLLATLKGSVGVPNSTETEIYENLMKIVDLNAGLNKSVSVWRPQTTKPLLSRGNSLQMIRNTFGIKRKVSQTEICQDSQTMNKSFISSYSQATLNDCKPETYSIGFSLRDTGINTVLLKLNSQLVKFSEVEVKKKFKETQKLQQLFNKLKEIQAVKQKEIENIATQITQLKAKFAEKEEILQKFANLQFQSNKSLEKVVIAQAEVDYVQKILESCEKNPPFIKEWNNDMIKAIEVCSEFIKSESVCIEQYEKDTFAYNNKFNELRAAINEKRSAGTSTLTKLSEKYSLNAYINKSIVKGFNRRKLLLMTPDNFEHSAGLVDKIKIRKNNIKKVVKTKNKLETKVNKFEELVKKIVNTSKDFEGLDINAIIFKFQNYSELLHQRNELSKNLTDLQTEKTHLEEKLKYLKSLNTKPEQEEEPKNFIDMIDKLETQKNRVLHIKDRVEAQQIKIVNIKEVYSQIWKNLGLDDHRPLEPKTIKDSFRDLYNKIQDFEAGRLRKPQVAKSHLIRAKTKVWNAIADKKLFSKAIENAFNPKGKLIN